MQFKLSTKKIISASLLIIGIIGIGICSYYRYLPAYTEQDTGYISPFGAVIAAIYPGCIFLIYISGVLLLKRRLIKTTLIILGLLALYGYIFLSIAAYSLCIDVCIDDKNAVIGATNQVLMCYYILGPATLMGSLVTDNINKKKKNKQ